MYETVPAARRRGLIILATALLLSACGSKEPPIGASPAERGPAVAVAGPPSFVGLWASAPAVCARPWVLKADSLQSPSVLACQFVKVEPTSAGYTVWSTCSVGKAAAPTRLVFTLTGEGNRSLTLTGGPFDEPLALGKCDAATQSASTDASRIG